MARKSYHVLRWRPAASPHSRIEGDLETPCSLVLPRFHDYWTNCMQIWPGLGSVVPLYVDVKEMAARFNTVE